MSTGPKTVRWDDPRRRRTAAVADLIWTGREVTHLRRLQDNLRAAHRVLGRNDGLANLLLEDALADLQSVLGEQATPVAEWVGGGRPRSA